MKNLILLLLLFSGAALVAQEGVTMKRSTVLKIEEVPPTWPGCTGSISQKSNCLNQNLASHVVKNMKIPGDYKAGAKVIVDMVINKQGLPVVNSIKGGTPGMRKAVRTAVMTIPKLKPGHMGGTKKESKLQLPFQF